MSDGEIEGAIEGAIDALFAGPQAAFIAARNALAKQRKAEGDADAAAAIKALAKPSVSAWAVNQLWWHHRAAMEALRDAGEQVRAAAARGAGPAGQAAARKARRAALTGLCSTAEGVLADAGHARGAATLRKISASLEAIAAYGHADVEPPLGRFSTELAAPGFETLAALGGIGAPRGTARDNAADPHQGADRGNRESDAVPGALRVVPPAAPEAPSPNPSVAKRPAPPDDGAAAAIADAERALTAAQLASDAAAAAVDRYAQAADDATLQAERSAAAHADAQTRLQRATHRAQQTEATQLHHARLASDAAAALARAQAELKTHHDAVEAATAALARVRATARE